MTEIKDAARLAKTISELEIECFPKDYWLENAISAQLAHESCIQYICYDDENGGKAVGYVLGSFCSGEAELYRIGVLHDYRGRGIAFRLMQRFVAECIRRKTEKIFLEVRSKNEAAVNLYKKCGFYQIAIRKDYYGDDSALVMELELEK